MKLFRKHTGKGQYKDICWWVYKLEKPVGGYTHVYCMPYAITEEMMTIAASGKVKRDANTPDLDKKGTGNIHPSVNDVIAAVKDLRVRQLVLCVWHENIRQFGPALASGMACDGTVYHYYNADVPAANYYPMITRVEDMTSEEQEKQSVLQNVAILFKRWLEESSCQCQ